MERVARSICGDGDIAATLADIFDVLGAHGAIEVREGGRDWAMSSSWARIGRASPVQHRI